MKKLGIALALCFGVANANTLIKNLNILDGTGKSAFRGSVRIAGEKIAEVGAKLKPKSGETIVDGKGLLLTPGFIDTHSHHDWGLANRRDATAAISQGITTIIVGQDGSHNYPLANFFATFRAKPATVNLASFAGHNYLRGLVMGANAKRKAKPSEIAAMSRLLGQEMKSGALGLSTGLEYEPGLFSDTKEVLTLAKVAARYKGRYISHLRNEDIYLKRAINELLIIGKEAKIPVQISHTKIAARSGWGSAAKILQMLDQARKQGIQVSADIYPYAYWQSTLLVLFPKRQITRKAAEFALKEVVAAKDMTFTAFDPKPSYIGKTLAEIAKLRGENQINALLNLARMAKKMREQTGSSVSTIIAKSMDERDIETLINWPHMNFCSDGTLNGSHPRGFGAFTRFLGHYVNKRQALPLATAIHKASMLPAKHMGIKQRGQIKTGFYADLVLLDKQVRDRAVPGKPHLKSKGIHLVWVNGKVVYRQDKATKERPGKVLTR